MYIMYYVTADCSQIKQTGFGHNILSLCLPRHYFPVFSVLPVTWPVSAPLQSHLRNIFCLHNFSFYKNPLSVLCLLHPAFICIQKTCPCQFCYPFLHTKRTLAKICQCPYYIFLNHTSIQYKRYRNLFCSNIFSIYYVDMETVATG